MAIGSRVSKEFVMKRFPIFVLLAALVAMVLAACGDTVEK